jgi:tRNA modification GTPase
MAFCTTDTIVAIATPPGRGGIGVVRISGPDAQPIAQRLITHGGDLQPRRATFTCLRSPERDAICDVADAHVDAIDQAIATYFPAPHSYTGEHVVELSAHGSPVILREIVASAMAHGARLAEPGEFTLRAFLNGRLDLMQAEAVADLVEAVTPLQARAAFDQLEGTLTRAIAGIDAALFDLIAQLEASVDFPEEGFHFVTPCALAKRIEGLLARTSALLADACRGRVVREGLQVAIVGRPNVGKSSVFNALVGASRAIVTDVPGTTRDLVTETVDLEGLRVTLVDTAGLRDTADRVEAEGVSRARGAVEVADLVLVVVDEDAPVRLTAKHFVVQNKCDLPRPARGLRVSARTGEGIDALRRAIAAALDVDLMRERPAITNIRHIALVRRAHDALARARAAALPEGGSLSEEFVLADLQDARGALEEITGRRASEDLLAHIFSRFCIGK